jgi:septum site-determining protein MinD
MAKFIVVASGKGGVGKTTVTINLASAIASHDKDVTVVDCDLMNPNVSLILGHEKVESTLHDVLKGEKQLSESTYTHPSGVKVIPASISLADIQHSDYEKLFVALNELHDNTEIVLIDSHPGINADAQELFKLADEILVVTAPELGAVTDAMKTIRMAESIGSTVVGVVLNRVEGKKYEMKKEDIESFLEKPVIGEVPEDSNVKKSILENYPVFDLYPRSSSSLVFRKMAGMIAGVEAEADDGFFRDILKIFRLR